jgi:hypothetical protein
VAIALWLGAGIALSGQTGVQHLDGTSMDPVSTATKVEHLMTLGNVPGLAPRQKPD